MRTRKTRTPLWLILLLVVPGLAADLKGPYLGQKLPGSVPEVFAPGVISVAGSGERSLSLSSNGDEWVFTRGSGWPHSRIMHMKRRGEEWSPPEPLSCLKDDWATQAVFSPDGQYLYFSTSRGKPDIRYFSLWRSKKIGDGWSEPESVIDMGGGLKMEFHPSVARNGSVYFLYWDYLKEPAQLGDLYVAKLIDGKYAEPVLLGPPISTEYNEVRPTVDPDEKYLLFESDRPGGYGGTDIYIAVRNSDGTWSSPRNLGPTVNTPANDDTPNISPDGKYWLYSLNGDIYWRQAPALPAQDMPNPKDTALSEPASKTDSPEFNLLGKWVVTLGGYSDTWTFKEGGEVTSAQQPDLKGAWKKETNCILIQWEEVEAGYMTWEAFTLPLKEEGTRGGNWTGLRVLAKKVSGIADPAASPTRPTALLEPNDGSTGKAPAPVKQTIPYGANDAAGHRLRVGDAEIYYEVYGEGPPLLLLHGGFYGYIDGWAEYIPILSKQFRVIAMATRGHGKSGIGSQPFSRRLFADDAAAVLKRETDQPAVVIGSSGGANTACMLAAVYPDRIKKVVAIAPGLKPTQLSSEWAKNLPQEIERQLGGFVTARKQLMPEPERWNEFVEKYGAACMAKDDVTDEQARSITCPALIVGGDRDQFVPLSEFVRVRSLIRNSRLLILPDCDHSSTKRRPVVLREFILPFVQE